MSFAILRQGDCLIAVVQDDLSDREILELRDDLADRVGRDRIRGVVIDVAALDVIDSFVARALQSVALIARLRGAATVVAGFRPEVALAMVQFRLDLEPLRPALDLDDALARLRGASRGEADDGR